MNAREVARRVLARVDEGAYATLALSGELDRARGLHENDRGLATELVYGVLKRRLRLDWALGALAPRGLDALDARTLDALRLGAYQILFLRIPAHAAVDDAVEAVKHARGAKLAGFANALLRRLAREGEPAPPPEKDLAAHLSVVESAPRWLVEDALRRFPPDEARAFLASLNQPAPLWLRASSLRGTRDELQALIAADRPNARLEPSPLVDEALRVEGGGDLFHTRAYAEGRFLAQDVAAQIVARLVEPRAGESLLDACAGVGGKSTHLAALTGDRARIDAADLSERKLELCADHARRLGAASIATIACDLTDERAPLQPGYDRVLLDAPCTGLGVLRRHPEAKWRREAADAVALAELQAELLAALAGRVKPGGLLVYSVCTFSDEEGPRQIAAFAAAHPEFAVEPPSEPRLAALCDERGALRTWPHRHDADGFFAVRLRRKTL
ncbi:MAG TPA: 16S rRNA (cytosine(967)-C(5))-methyltransferase RsmB [Polyangia bacterium]|nr:16S rRNA (cytosine(967)-C(5))-methyltransferase RsmB [Polyangia bacterium]